MNQGSAIGREVDVLVVGSGAAGLTAALVAASGGLDVLVVEKTGCVGGTTALSEGMAWIPCSRQAIAAGIVDSRDEALRYIESTAGPHYNPQRARAYVDNAAAALEFIETHGGARFELVRGSIDYYDVPGSLAGGRALRPCHFDGRELGADFARLRAPLATTMLFGGLPILSSDLPHYFSLAQSWPARWQVATIMARYAADRVRGWPRGTRLGNGNALVAALWRSLARLGVEVRTGTRLVALLREGVRVRAARLDAGGTDVTVHARRGVVLAGGGFPGNAELRRRFYPHVREGKDHVVIAPASNTGDTLAAALDAGAGLDADVSQPAAWSPASTVARGGLGSVPFPHYIDRGKPGVIAVDPSGRRFTNEADPYQDFVPAMIAACARSPASHAFLIADHRALRRYGLGVVPPSPGRIAGHIRSGYLVRAGSLDELGVALRLPPGSLRETVEHFNGHARRGVDPDFGRGSRAYNRAAGDPRHQPNPTLGALDAAPYYAVKVSPGDIGTFVGLATDGHARVLQAGDRRPIEGLYAAGNDATSPMGGRYPAAGITIGAAVTFGYVAARHLVSGSAKGDA